MYYTAAEIKKMYEGRYADIEFYKFRFNNRIIHTDYIEYIEDVSDDAPVEDFELMDEERYNFSVLANCCGETDFKTWYGSSEARVLVVIVADDYNEDEDE